MKSNQPDDEPDLIARIKAGDLELLGILFTRYESQLLRFIDSRINNIAISEDILGDVFINVLEGLERYEDRGYPFSAWLYRIAYARIVDKQRQDGRRTSVTLSPLLASNYDVEAVIDEKVAIFEILKSFKYLTDDQWIVCMLRIVFDKSIEETALNLGRTMAQVKALQGRGKLRIQRSLLDPSLIKPLSESWFRPHMVQLLRNILNKQIDGE